MRVTIRASHESADSRNTVAGLAGRGRREYAVVVIGVTAIGYREGRPRNCGSGTGATLAGALGTRGGGVAGAICAVGEGGGCAGAVAETGPGMARGCSGVAACRRERRGQRVSQTEPVQVPVVVKQGFDWFVARASGACCHGHDCAATQGALECLAGEERRGSEGGAGGIGRGPGGGGAVGSVSGVHTPAGEQVPLEVWHTLVGCAP